MNTLILGFFHNPSISLSLSLHTLEIQFRVTFFFFCDNWLGSNHFQKRRSLKSWYKSDKELHQAITENLETSCNLSISLSLSRLLFARLSTMQLGLYLHRDLSRNCMAISLPILYLLALTDFSMRKRIVSSYAESVHQKHANLDNLNVMIDTYEDRLTQKKLAVWAEGYHDLNTILNLIIYSMGTINSVVAFSILIAWLINQYSTQYSYYYTLQGELSSKD